MTNWLYRLLIKIRIWILSYPRTMDITDEYIKWLTSANPGFVHEGNLYCFKYAVDHIKSTKPIVEIGAFCGLSTNIMNYYLYKAKRKNTIFSCDSWKYTINKQKSVDGFSVSGSEFGDFVKASYLRNTVVFSKPKTPHGFQTSSDDFFDSWQKNAKYKDIAGNLVQLGGEISFSYIDGDHSYRQAKRDFENVDKFLEKGGFILFDDSAPFSGHECSKLMPEILKNEKYKLIIKNPNYLFQKIAK